MVDPIYALATPVGRSAIAVVRLSGSPLPKKLLNLLSLNKKTRGMFLRSLNFGSFSDKCLVLNFPAPNSYTGEHLVEIHTHGNPAIVAELFSFLEGYGLREATHGEFSRRAFVNNKMDLSSAESVMSGICAETSEELSALEDFRVGALGSKIKKLSSKLESLLVSVESQLDFSDEEGVASVSKRDVSNEVSNISNNICSLLDNFSPYMKDSQRKKVVLTGSPNVGKSSLFNSLVGEKVAIVSDQPGTTRDIVRTSLFLAGVEVSLEDTAGVRDVKDSQIEKEGIELGQETAKSADLVIEVYDNPGLLPKTSSGPLVVLNKSDLHSNVLTDNSFVLVSAKTGEGVSELQSQILKKVSNPVKQNLVSERIYIKLETANGLLKNLSNEDDFFETTAQRLRDSLIELQNIYGVFDNETILDQIFNNFCIGK